MIYLVVRLPDGDVELWPDGRMLVSLNKARRARRVAQKIAATTKTPAQ